MSKKKTEKWPKSHEKYPIWVPFFACDSENEPASLPKYWFQHPDCVWSASEQMVQFQSGMSGRVSLGHGYVYWRISLYLNNSYLMLIIYYFFRTPHPFHFHSLNQLRLLGRTSSSQGPINFLGKSYAPSKPQYCCL